MGAVFDVACVYRKPKPNVDGDEVRKDVVRFDASGRRTGRESGASLSNDRGLMSLYSGEAFRIREGVPHFKTTI